MATTAGEVLEDVRGSFTISRICFDYGSKGPFAVLVLEVVDPCLSGSMAVLMKSKVQGRRTERTQMFKESVGNGLRRVVIEYPVGNARDKHLIVDNLN